MPRKPGAWVIEAQGETIIESSEIKALRLAASQGGVATYVPYGQSLSQAKANPAGSESEPATPYDEPTPEQSGGEDQAGEF